MAAHWKTKIRAFLTMVRDAALLQWPWLQPVIKWLQNEANGVRKGWVLFSILTIAIGVGACWITARITGKESAVLRKSLNSTNAFFQGSLKEIRALRETDRRAHESEITQMKIDLNEIKRSRDTDIARITAERDNALLRVSQLESIPSNAVYLYSTATNLINASQYGSPSFEFRINGQMITNEATVILTNTRTLALQIKNVSEITAEQATISFSVPLALAKTNITADGWSETLSTMRVIEGGEIPIANRWKWAANQPIMGHENYHAASIVIATNFTQPVISVDFGIYALRSKRQNFSVAIAFKQLP